MRSKVLRMLKLCVSLLVSLLTSGIKVKHCCREFLLYSKTIGLFFKKKGIKCQYNIFIYLSTLSGVPYGVSTGSRGVLISKSCVNDTDTDWDDWMWFDEPYVAASVDNCNVTMKGYFITPMDNTYTFKLTDNSATLKITNASDLGNIHTLVRA